MKLLVINGPNLNLLGLREPAIYGSQNYESLLALIRAACDAEGIEAVAIPAVEVHISDVDSREPFRQVSYAGMACVKTYKGLGFQGYVEAVKFLKDYLSK